MTACCAPLSHSSSRVRNIDKTLYSRIKTSELPGDVISALLFLNILYPIRQKNKLHIAVKAIDSQNWVSNTITTNNAPEMSVTTTSIGKDTPRSMSLRIGIDAHHKVAHDDQ
jgi:hypothetical protein